MGGESRGKARTPTGGSRNSGPAAGHLEIFADEPLEGTWARGLAPSLAACAILPLKSRGRNSDAIDRLLAYDRPDVILTMDGRPVLVLEKTTEVPTGHNTGQRMGRLVRAAELRVPVIMFLPFDARKHGTYTGICHLNIRLLEAFRRMTEIHGVPVLAVNWPADRNGELVRDGRQDSAMRSIITGFVDSGFSPTCSAFVEANRIMVEEYRRRLVERPAYGRPPGTVRIVATSEVVALAKTRAGGPVRFEAGFEGRRETVVYNVGMTPEACRREDPYTGTQFIYDYQFCRNGPLPEDKSRNLVIDCRRVTRDQWTRANPNDPRRKSSLWYATANAILLRDGVVLIR